MKNEIISFLGKEQTNKKTIFFFQIQNETERENTKKSKHKRLEIKLHINAQMSVTDTF